MDEPRSEDASPQPHLAIDILGSLRVRNASGEIGLYSEKQRRLLAVLVVQRGQVVSTDKLTAALWGEHPTPSADKSLQTYVARLRRTLGTPPGTPGHLQTRPPGYILDIDPMQIDANRFEQLHATAVQALNEEPDTALALLDEALELWRGEPLAEFGDLDFAVAEAERLKELHTTAHENRFEAQLALGLHQSMVGPLEVFAGQHPFRERPHAQLMLALYRSGRHADALSAFSAFRRDLTEELGLEPSESLRTLETKILQQDPGLDHQPSGPVSAAPVPKPHPTVSPRAPRSPPAPTSGLVGREPDLAAVVDLVSSARVVTIVGAPGVGKTRLAQSAALAVAEEFRDAVYWSELGAISNEDAVAGAVCTACGVTRGDHERPEADLMGFIGRQRVLLVIDNCEHVIRVIAALVEDLVEQCANLVVLATSRRPLSVAGEHLYPLDRLSLVSDPIDDRGPTRSDAAQLFVERARAVDPGFELNDANAGSVVHICSSLDGLPLAIELAAAQIRHLTPIELAADLEGRLESMGGRRRNRLTHHRSLRDTIGWSYELLDADHQLLFDRLSVFAGSFDARGVRALADETGPPAAIERQLAELVDHSLLHADRSGPTTRYSMLETIRSYGRNQLRASGRHESTRRTFADWVAAMTEGAAEELRGPTDADAVAALDREFANIRSAVHWAVGRDDADHAFRICAALTEYAYHRLSDEAFDWAQLTLRQPDAAAHPLFVPVEASLASGLLNRGQLSEARRLAEHVLASPELDDRSAMLALHALGLAALYEGRLDDAVTVSHDEIDLARRVGDAYAEAYATLTLVLAHGYGGDHDLALALAEEQLALARRSQSDTQIAWALYGKGETLRSSQPEQALQLLRDAVAVAQRARAEFVTGVALVTIATLLAREGDLRRALHSLVRITKYWRQRGDWTHLWTTIRNVVFVLDRLEEDEPAAILLGALSDAGQAPASYGEDSENIDLACKSVTARLGSDRFDKLAAQGRILDAEQVVTLVESIAAELEPV